MSCSARRRTSRVRAPRTRAMRWRRESSKLWPIRWAGRAARSRLLGTANSLSGAGGQEIAEQNRHHALCSRVRAILRRATQPARRRLAPCRRSRAGTDWHRPPAPRPHAFTTFNNSFSTSTPVSPIWDRFVPASCCTTPRRSGLLQRRRRRPAASAQTQPRAMSCQLEGKRLASLYLGYTHVWLLVQTLLLPQPQ